jgi:hypothetical protein
MGQHTLRLNKRRSRLNPRHDFHYRLNGLLPLQECLMFRPLPVFIGLRYTGAKRRNHFISFISAMSMAGLVLGVMVLIIVLSVMNGFDRELRQRILGMVPHAKR